MRDVPWWVRLRLCSLWLWLWWLVSECNARRMCAGAVFGRACKLTRSFATRVSALGHVVVGVFGALEGEVQCTGSCGGCRREQPCCCLLVLCIPQEIGSTAYAPRSSRSSARRCSSTIAVIPRAHQLETQTYLWKSSPCTPTNGCFASICDQ